MAAASVLQTLGAGGRSAARAAAVAQVAAGAGLLRARARFGCRPGRALQRERTAADPLPGKALGQPAGRAAPLVLRRGTPAPFLGCHRLAPSAGVPAGADRDPAQR